MKAAANRLSGRQLRRRLKLRDLDTLMVVTQCGSMAKAAIQLAMSQPAVSKAISDMEQALGVPLFDRTARGVEPTIYGNVLLKWSNAVFDDLRQGIGEIESLSDPTVGELRIGATEPMLCGFVPAVLARLHRHFPRLSFDVRQANALAQQRHDLQERRVDLIIGRVVRGDPDETLATEVLFEEPWSVVAGARNPLARRRRLALADLLQEPWSLPPTGNVLGTYLIESFRAAGLDQPHAVVTCNSIEMHRALMVNGPFLAIFPRSLLRFSPDRQAVKVLPVTLPGPPPPVGITFLKNRTLSPTTQRFINYARELAKPIRS